MKDQIESMADTIVGAGMCVLPDVTPIQKTINRLYAQLRIGGMPIEEVTKQINIILSKHNISKKELLKLK